MPRRSILSAAERESLLTLPDTKDELIRLYTFNDADLSRIRQHRGAANRLGFAVQLCYMRYPGVTLAADAKPDAAFCAWWLTNSSGPGLPQTGQTGRLLLRGRISISRCNRVDVSTRRSAPYTKP